MRAALDILALSQDAEAIDALFSIRPDLLDKLLGMEYAVVSVQVADSLIALALAGADLEHPRRRDLRQILSLALLHGEAQAKIYDFIASYERE